MDFFANYLKLFDISEACWPLRFDLHVEDALDCIDCLLPAEAVPYKLLEVPVLDYLKGKLYGARGDRVGSLFLFLVHDALGAFLAP